VIITVMTAWAVVINYPDPSSRTPVSGRGADEKYPTICPRDLDIDGACTKREQARISPDIGRCERDDPEIGRMISYSATIIGIHTINISIVYSRGLWQAGHWLLWHHGAMCVHRLAHGDCMTASSSTWWIG
jgi:hypothetical protein